MEASPEPLFTQCKKMAQKILGMMGPGQGPMVFTSNLGEAPRAQITGLLKGFIQVFIYNSREELDGMIALAENGTFPLVSAMYMRIECPEGNPHMICTLLSGASRAVHSPG